MATINEITNAAGYTGNAALGGYAPSAIEIDTKPLQLLAQYTVAYNKAEYDQRQKDSEAKAAEIADLATIDFSKIDPKWQQPIKEGFDKITQLARNNPNVQNYKDKDYPEYKRLVAELNQAVKSGKANTIVIEKRSGDIKAETNVQSKILKQKRLDEDKEKTGLYDTMPIEESYNLTIKKPVNPAALQTTVISRLPNSTVTNKYSLPDMKKINEQANLFSMNEKLEGLDVTKTPAYLNAKTDAERTLMVQEQEARGVERQKDGWSLLGKTTNELLNSPQFKFKGATGGEETSMELLLKDPATKEVAEMIQKFNEAMEAKKAEIRNGKYTDESGTPISESDYYPIDVKDGISTAELARIQILADVASESRVAADNFNGDASANQRAKDNNAVTIRGQNMNKQEADADRAERKAAREAKGLPPLPAGDAADKGNIMFSVNGFIGGDKNKRIVNGLVQDGSGNFDPTFSKEIKIDAEATGSYIQSWYNKYNFQAGDSKSPKVDIKNGKLTAQFKNGIIVGIKSTNGGFITFDEFQKISDENSQKKENKYISETNVGVSGDSGILP